MKSSRVIVPSEKIENQLAAIEAAGNEERGQLMTGNQVIAIIEIHNNHLSIIEKEAINKDKIEEILEAIEME